MQKIKDFNNNLNTRKNYLSKFNRTVNRLR